MNYYLKNFFLW